jgi:hypothetical protein
MAHKLLENSFGLCYTFECGKLFTLFFNMLRETTRFVAGRAREDKGCPVTCGKE